VWWRGYCLCFYCRAGFWYTRRNYGKRGKSEGANYAPLGAGYIRAGGVVALLGLLVFLGAGPDIVRPSLKKEVVKTQGPGGITLSEEAQKRASIDGFAESISTTEVKKPVIITPDIAGELSTDGMGAKEAAPASVAESEVQPEPVEKKVSHLTYEARSGDSYTVIVRAAISHVADMQGTPLSLTQRVAAETLLAQGAVELAISEQVVLSVETIEAVIEKAQALEADELAAWGVFAERVDWTAEGGPELAGSSVGGIQP